MSFFVFESIDGAGKGTVSYFWIRLLKEHYGWSDNDFFNVDEYSKKRGFLPQFFNPERTFFVNPDNFFLYKSFEPTFSGVGLNLREHVLKFENYSSYDVALQFSLDRRTLYERVIIPLKEKKKFIVQERSFVSSLVYQVEHSKFFGGSSLSINDILSFEGNKIAFDKKNMFDFLFILYLPYDEAHKRLRERSKHDNVIYEQNVFFQKTLLEKYLSEDLQKLLLNFNPNLKIIYFDVSKSLEETKSILKNIFEEYVNNSLNTINHF